MVTFFNKSYDDPEIPSGEVNTCGGLRKSLRYGLRHRSNPTLFYPEI
jgi:hypothetical protein